MNEEPRALVRAYSNDLQSRDTRCQTHLERLVAEKERDRQRKEQDWRVYFESWEPTESELRHAKLRKEGVHLMEAWNKFHDQFPNETGKIDGRNPTVGGLIGVIQRISADWNDERKRKRLGAAKRHFHNICANLKAHSTMLELLPAGSEYVSLFTGTLTTIVKASVNHERIIADIGKSLDEITIVVAECTEICKMYNTEEVQMRIAMMYAHIFLFLKDIMAWYTDKAWKRALRSLNENFYDEFEEQITAIKKLAAGVKQQAEMGTSAELRVTRLTLEQMQSTLIDMRIEASHQTRADAETAARLHRLERNALIETQQKQRLLAQSPEKLQSLAVMIGDQMFEFLETRAIKHLETRLGRVEDISYQAIPEHAILHIDSPRAETRGREEFMEISRDLELYFDREQVRLQFDFPKVAVSNKISHGLRHFVADAEEPMLAVAGPRLLDHRGLATMTKVAASFISHAEQVGIPVVSWFCQSDAGIEGSEDIATEESLLVALVYALIRQLIELLPTKPSDPISVNFDEVEMLDGTLATLDTAILLLEDLVAQVDSTLFIVVDGLQWLDNEDTRLYLGDAVLALVNGAASARKSSEPQQLLVRVLLTTSGRSSVLLDTLEPDVYLLADDNGRKGRGENLLFF